MTWFKKKNSSDSLIEYNPEEQRAIIKCSICNGEQLAGFKDIKTGKFTEVMLIKSKEDLASFQKMYGLTDVAKEY